jgi:hypothetical protein
MSGIHVFDLVCIKSISIQKLLTGTDKVCSSLGSSPDLDFCLSEIMFTIITGSNHVTHNTGHFDCPFGSALIALVVMISSLATNETYEHPDPYNRRR